MSPGYLDASAARRRYCAMLERDHDAFRARGSWLPYEAWDAMADRLLECAERLPSNTGPCLVVRGLALDARWRASWWEKS